MKKFCGLFLSLLYFNTMAQSPGSNADATDVLGRKLPTFEEVGPPKKDKFIGLFYWTWHTKQANNPPFNTTEYLAKDPRAIDNYDHPIWPKKNSPFFWGEPLFGYYRDTDAWVLRKHAEMLADAGVDVIIFDCTNGNLTWKESYMKLCEVFTQARKDGVQTPQIAFMLPFSLTQGGKEIISEIYRDLYKPGMYRDLWFYWKGKPLIMALPELVPDIAGQADSTAFNREVKNFFTFRPGQPVYNKGPQRPDHWGWLEIYPQHGFVKKATGAFEQVTVGVAQNWSKERGLTAMNAPGAFGRSYTHKNGHSSELGAVNKGLNFQEQWDHALQINPELIFVTGWNEWIAGRYKMWQQQTNAFPDEFDQEGSRDIEPMENGHGDNYFYQMVSNIRRFKGVPAQASSSSPVTISINGNFKDWEGVMPNYKSYKGNTLHRNSSGWGSLQYINNTGRNDIVLSKVARDDQFVYFYVETAAPLSPKTDSAWMRLFIDIDRNKATGWQGYDYIINRTSPKKSAVLEKSGYGWLWEKAGDIDYAINANKLEIRVPRSMLGIKDEIDLEFKWADNMQKDNDVMDFWLNGDVAPGGRSNYHYKSK